MPKFLVCLKRLILPYAIFIFVIYYPQTSFSKSYLYNAQNTNKVIIPNYSGDILGVIVNNDTSRIYKEGKIWDLKIKDEIFQLDQFEKSKISNFQTPFFHKMPKTVGRAPLGVVKTSAEYAASLVQMWPTRYEETENISNNIGYTIAAIIGLLFALLSLYLIKRFLVKDKGETSWMLIFLIFFGIGLIPGAFVSGYFTKNYFYIDNASTDDHLVQIDSDRIVKVGAVTHTMVGLRGGDHSIVIKSARKDLINRTYNIYLESGSDIFVLNLLGSNKYTIHVGEYFPQK